MQRRLSTTATVAGVNGDLFNLSVGYPSGLLLMNGVLASPPNPDRSSTGISPDGTLARRPREVRGNVAGRRAAPAARAEQGSRRGRDRAVHVGVRPGDTGGERDGRGRPDAVSGGRAASRPRRHRRAGEAGRRDPDPAGRCGARRARSDRRRPARDRGAARVERDRPPDADARLVGTRRRRRRRADADARGTADLPGERRVHDRPAGSAGAANRGRPDAGRAHRARHGRRTARRLQRRDDELRARVVPDAPRRVDRVGARRRRLVDDGVRRARCSTGPPIPAASARSRSPSVSSTTACTFPSCRSTSCRRTATTSTTA